MAKKTAYTHPFLVKVELPAGHPFGRKKRTHIRNSRHKTLGAAMQEQQALRATGATIALVYEGKLCIYNSTNKPVDAYTQDFGARGLRPHEGIILEEINQFKGIIKLKTK